MKILIAEADDSFCWALQMKLQERFHVCICTDGMETVELIHRFSPDIAIVDLELPGLNGKALVQQLEREKSNTKYIWTASAVNAQWALWMGEQRMENFMQKPCPVYAVLDRIESLAWELYDRAAEEDSKKQITDLLILLNISVKLKGYRYIKEAVRLMAEDPEQSITKELYPSIAAACGGSAQQVERAIRGAIYAAWDKRDLRVWNNLLGESFCIADKKPTNAEFIRRLTELIYVKNLVA